MFNEEMTSKIQPATVVLVVEKKKWRTFHSFQEEELPLEGDTCYLENICGAGQT